MTELPEIVRVWLESHSAMSLVVLGAALVWGMRQIWIILRSTWPGLKKLVHFLDSLTRLPEFMTSMSEWKETATEKLDANAAALEVVRREVLPNHGSSLRDAVEAIRKRTKAVESNEAVKTEQIGQLAEGVKLLSSTLLEEDDDYRKQEIARVIENLMNLSDEVDWTQ